MKIIIIFLIPILLLSCSPDDTYMILEYKTGLDLHALESSGFIYPDNDPSGNIKDFYLIKSSEELHDFQESLFQFTINIEDDYFDNNILIIHPKATHGGSIDALIVSIDGDKVLVSYDWEEGSADCYCYTLIVIYCSLS